MQTNAWRHPLSRYGTIHTRVTIQDRKSTRLNSSHLVISYAVFCLKKKKPRYKHCHTHLPTQRRPSSDQVQCTRADQGPSPREHKARPETSTPAATRERPPHQRAC